MRESLPGSKTLQLWPDWPLLNFNLVIRAERVFNYAKLIYRLLLKLPSHSARLRRLSVNFAIGQFNFWFLLNHYIS